jgi:DivIVA domain-containing protein
VRLSPDDIVGYEFRQQKVRGYDVEQVDDLLDRLADQVEATDRELDDLRARLRDAEARSRRRSRPSRPSSARS